MELHEILIYGVAALGCFILAILIKGNRQAVLQLATDLINKAESTIQGSGMRGQEGSGHRPAAGCRHQGYILAGSPD